MRLISKLSSLGSNSALKHFYLYRFDFLVRMPFSRHEKRVLFYIAITFVVSIITAVFALRSSHDFNDGKSINFYMIFAWSELVEYFILVFVAITSILLACYRLCQPGV